MSYLPTFQTTPTMVNLVAEIVELARAFDVNPALVPGPTVRKINQLRTVHSSTWIEGNTLTFDEVTAVIDGKRVVAPEREIAEVQQAYAAYGALDGMDPQSLDDLLAAHGIMMRGIAEDAGRLREVEVGVYSGATLLHAGTPSAELPQAMAELFNWLKSADDHPLIQGCFFHCAFEGIHPFSDGNGRTGRLWHSLINRRWKSQLAWAPVETMVAESQQEYYRVLRVSNKGDATPFIEFMLEMLRDALTDVFVRLELGEGAGASKPGGDKENGTDDTKSGTNNGTNGTETTSALLKALAANPNLTVNEMAELVGKSRRQTLRVLSALQEAGRLRRVGSSRSGHWEVL